MEPTNGTAGRSWERPDAPLGTLVYRAGLLSKDKLEAALAEGQQTGRRLGEILLQKGWIEEKDLARLLAGQKGLAFVSLKGRGFDPELARRLTERTSRYHCALAMEEEVGTLLVAIADPTDDSAVSDIESELGKGFRLVVATASEIRSAHDQVFVEAPAPVATVLPITPASEPHADVSAFGLRVAPPPPDQPDAPEPEAHDEAPEPEAHDEEPDPFEAGVRAAEEASAPEPTIASDLPAEWPAGLEPEPAAVAQPEPEPAAAAEPEPAPAPEPLLSLGGLGSAASVRNGAEPSPEPRAAVPDPSAIQDPSAAFGPDRPLPSPPAAPDADARAETPSILSTPPSGEPTIQRNEERHVSLAFHAPAPVPDREPEPEPDAALTAEPDPGPKPEPEPEAALTAEPEPDPEPEPEPEREPAAALEAAPEPEPEAAVEPQPEPTPDPEAPPVAEPEPLRAAELAPSPAPEPTEAPAAHPLRVVLVLADEEELEVGSYADEAAADAVARDLIAQMARPDGWPRIGNRFLRPDRIVSIDIRERRSWTGSRARAAWAGEAQRAEP